MSAPCPPWGGIITLNIGFVDPVGTFPEERSNVPNVYPDPPFDTVIDSTFELELITTVASAPVPSPLMGTLV